MKNLLYSLYTILIVQMQEGDYWFLSEVGLPQPNKRVKSALDLFPEPSQPFSAGWQMPCLLISGSSYRSRSPLLL
jgi:hypothetical protein